jgi:hypothetical protein
MKLRDSWLAAVVILAFFGYLLFLCVYFVPVDYWIVKDGAKTTALITNDHPWTGHGDVVYSYTVDGQQYTETGSPDWEKPRPKAGDKCTVYYSVSHPWLSLLRRPKVLVERYAGGIVFLFGMAIAAISILVPELVRRLRRRRHPPLPDVRRGPPPLPNARRP